MHFETENSAFLNSVLNTQKINEITQVSQGILSTIVVSAVVYCYITREFHYAKRDIWRCYATPVCLNLQRLLIYISAEVLIFLQ